MKKIIKIALSFMFLLVSFSLLGCVSPYTYDNANSYAVGGSELSSAQTVNELEVDWVSGSVEIKHGNVDTITFSESSSNLTDSYKLRYKIENGTLVIKFCASGADSAKVGEKSLVITIPNDTRLNEVSLNVVSAEITVSSLKANELDVESVSGVITATDCKINNAEIESVSGNVSVSGEIVTIDVNTVSGEIECNVSTLREVEIESVSGNVEITPVGSMPLCLEVVTVSGNVRLNLSPADFSVKFTTVSGVFSSEYPTTIDANVYTYGDATNLFEVETISGNLRIYEI